MTWATLHEESERLAIEASLAVRSRRHESALSLYRRAAELEREAYKQLDTSKVRTRGITAVSAVALCYKASDFNAAEQLAYTLLADSSLPEFARDEIRNLVQAIWTENAKLKAGVSFVPGQVLVSVKGGEVVTGGAPLDLIVDKVQTIQSMFYRTIEFLNGMSHRRVGRPSKELQESCRPWLFQSPPGSYQFSVAIQKPKQPDFFSNEIEPERIAQHFLEIVGASASHDKEALEKIVPDESYRDTFLKLARNLAPTGKTFEKLEIRGSGDARSLSLDADSRTSINAHLRERNFLEKLSPKERVELRGTLRAVHLDKDWLELLVDGKSIHVEGLQDTVDDVIGPMVNRSVIVRASRETEKKFRFVDIELSD
jgi:hypothetical protein